jgi:hypothetical protein
MAMDMPVWLAGRRNNCGYEQRSGEVAFRERIDPGPSLWMLISGFAKSNH